mmetsp:Transcript_63803/g.156986  ORF Transcript_63803/g.156986 Transcript_63803/m.156986 type:complete len:354 (+) Transcript_63803:247-1308(+)|eukprot:CAMPEP_0206248554 /NCGR_PEP_ID=MMETSP0047_2-20121206/20433_1 /ASSEMBLY_ACC=CAM_ASM_000192 /TAXON_ID=195065 /ORGANISM="Chroomonas mesostigmatica_cf, Strain CCMP1168" /LENGTH=353 /DNA_ID=CAMNT_0053674209 /DNA_START=159 /DNA_END=1220 /DNA_ORIENTATION=-
MKRAFSLSELTESLEQGFSIQGTATNGGTMRRSKSTENLQRSSSRDKSGPPMSPGPGMPGSNSRMPMLSEKELREHFNMPLNEVAKKYGMCTTALKKLCRKYGVMQWPHRKLRSLEKKIASLRAEQRYTTDGQGHLDEEIRKLNMQREALITGRDDIGENEEPWSPSGNSPGDENEGDDGGYAPASKHGASFGDEDEAMRQSRSEDDARLSKHIKMLEDENSSLRALSRSLIKERQELLNKTNASSTEMAQLRKLCEQLQRQLAAANQSQSAQNQSAIDFNAIISASDEGHNAPTGETPVQADVKQKIPGGMVWASTGMDATGIDPMNHEGPTGQSLSPLSWMSPDFELEDLL